ncbi:MAG: hypothetical protein P4M00_01510 [Azospirillaceae bacterium]|nr:hypothetical protein [Azospirillaceae bacterium]
MSITAMPISESWIRPVPRRAGFQEVSRDGVYARMERRFGDTGATIAIASAIADDTIGTG